jgi:hypothetical protein
MMISGVIDRLVEAYEEAEAGGGELLKQLIAMALLEATRSHAGEANGADKAGGRPKRKPVRARAPRRRAPQRDHTLH